MLINRSEIAEDRWQCRIGRAGISCTEVQLSKLKGFGLRVTTGCVVDDPKQADDQLQGSFRARWWRIDQLNCFSDRSLRSGKVLPVEEALAESFQRGGKICASEWQGWAVGSFGREVDIEGATGGG